MVAAGSALEPWDDDDFKMGRLADTGEISEQQLFSGKYLSMGLRGYSRPGYRSSRGVAAGGQTPGYFGHTYISTRRWAQPSPRDGKIWVYPSHGEVAAVRAAGGRRDRSARCWYLAPDKVEGMGGVPIGWKDPGNCRSRGARFGGLVATAASLRAWQSYIERAEVEGVDREKEVARDGEGELSFGNLPGADPAERAEFWAQVVEAEGAGRRVQCRIQAELPCEAGPPEWRDVAERFCRVFEDRRLPYWAVVHLPHVEEGADGRNVHLHVAYFDRPFGPGSSLPLPSPQVRPESGSARDAGAGGAAVEDLKRRSSAAVPVPAAAAADTGGGRAGKRQAAPPPKTVSLGLARHKDREARGPAWITGLRARLFDISADVQRRLAAARGERAPKLFDARGYRELGIEKQRGEHLGPRRMALERAGIPTRAGLRNARREMAWERMRLAQATVSGLGKVQEEAVAMVKRLREFRSRSVGTDLPDTVIAEHGKAAETLITTAESLGELQVIANRRRAVADAVLARAFDRRRWASRMSREAPREVDRVRAAAIMVEADSARRVIEAGMGQPDAISEQVQLPPEVRRLFERAPAIDDRTVAAEGRRFTELAGSLQVARLEERVSADAILARLDGAERRAQLVEVAADLRWSDDVLARQKKATTAVEAVNNAARRRKRSEVREVETAAELEVRIAAIRLGDIDPREAKQFIGPADRRAANLLVLACEDGAMAMLVPTLAAPRTPERNEIPPLVRTEGDGGAAAARPEAGKEVSFRQKGAIELEWPAGRRVVVERAQAIVGATIPVDALEQLAGLATDVAVARQARRELELHHAVAVAEVAAKPAPIGDDVAKAVAWRADLMSWLAEDRGRREELVDLARRGMVPAAAVTWADEAAVIARRRAQDGDKPATGEGLRRRRRSELEL